MYLVHGGTHILKPVDVIGGIERCHADVSGGECVQVVFFMPREKLREGIERKVSGGDQFTTQG